MSTTAPKPARRAYSQADGKGAYEVRLVMRYEDGNERETAKAQGYRWDAARKEWYLDGLTEQRAKTGAETWDMWLRNLPERPSVLWTRRPQRPGTSDMSPHGRQEYEERIRVLKRDHTTALNEIEALHTRLSEANTEVGILRDRVRHLTEQADTKQKVHTLYKGTCPQCGEDVFFQTGEAVPI